MTIKELIERLSGGKEPDLFNKLADSKTDEETYQIVKDAGVTTGKDETLKELKTWKVSLKSLSDEQLEKVAGGQVIQHGAQTGTGTSNRKC